MITQNQAADMFGVSRASVQSAKKVLKSGIGELIDLVAFGALPVHKGVKALDIPRTHLEELLRDGGLYSLTAALDAMVPAANDVEVLKLNLPMKVWLEFDEARGLLSPEQFFVECFKLWKAQHGYK